MFISTKSTKDRLFVAIKGYPMKCSIILRIKLAKLRRQGNYLQVEEMLHQEIVGDPKV